MRLSSRKRGDPFFANLLFLHNFRGRQTQKLRQKQAVLHVYVGKRKGEKKKFAKLTYFRLGLITFSV